MDDDLRDLENELKQLRPKTPSDVLSARLERELARSRATERSHAFTWRWVAFPVAAAIAVGAAMLASRPHARSTRPVPQAGERSSAAMLKPISAENILYAARDEGVTTLPDGTPVRRARLQYVDTFVWRNPRTNASLTWSVPREEIRVVPVSFQ